MDITFITIHDLSDEARILYSSDSIVDILGYTPEEVVGKSSWDFFHPEELPWAQRLHNRSVELDKAAVLAYCQIRDRRGKWVGCECCFSICYDVIVVCTSVYHRGIASQKRAAEAPIVRRLFSSSPQDPRYHMLSHLSSKFSQDKQEQSQEPRAALFLNRFTRSLTIMYATSGIEAILGIPAGEMKGQSFYCCIAENCLRDAVECLETAKSNDSIAYMRFWFRDPRQDGPLDRDSSDDDTDASMTDVTVSEDDEDGGVRLNSTYTEQIISNGDEQKKPCISTNGITPNHQNQQSIISMPYSNGNGVSRLPQTPDTTSRTLNGVSNDNETTNGHANGAHTDISPSVRYPRSFSNGDCRSIELEAVVSCTSDGLVVCIRRARKIMDLSPHESPGKQANYANGLFAAPWAPRPVYFPPQQQTHYQTVSNRNLSHTHDEIPPYATNGHHPHTTPFTYTSPQTQYLNGSAQQDFMDSIREVAVFAWALTGINRSLESFSRGRSVGASPPPTDGGGGGGLHVWNPHHDVNSNGTTAVPIMNGINGSHQPIDRNGGYRSRNYPFGDPGL